MSSDDTLSFQLHAKTDSGLRSCTFSLKINKSPAFLKSLKRGNV